MQAGQDITMTGATLAALGENGSMILSAGHNLTMDTDSLEAKKDMTENSDNYIRTYRKTETTNTLATGECQKYDGTFRKRSNNSCCSFFRKG